MGPEIDELRTARSSTFLTVTAGVFSTQVFDEPVHFQRPDGSWRRIDTDLVPTSEGDGFRASASPTHVEIADTADAESLVSVGVGDGLSVDLGLDGAGAVEPTVAGPEASFAGAIAGVDVSLVATPSGVKETLVLTSSSSSPRSLTFSLDLSGLDASIAESGAVEFREASDSGGDVVLVVPAGFMVDAAGVRSEGVTYTLDEGLGGEVGLLVALDDDWLGDPARVWPVAVDPTVMVPADTDDTYVIDGETPAVDHSAESSLEVGFDGVAARRGLLRFDLDGTDLDDEDIDVHYADLVLGVEDTATCPDPWAPSAMELYSAPDPWTGTTAAWPGPDLTGLDPLLPDQFSFGFRGGCPSGESRAQITPLVQDWVDTPASNEGVVLKAGDEGDADQFWQFTSADGSSGQPHIEVYWTVPDPAGPDTPEALSPTGALGTLNPILLARYHHPEDEFGYLALVLRLADTHQVLGYDTFRGPDGQRLLIPSTARVAILIGTGLPPELDYEWRSFAYTDDPELASDSTDWIPMSTPPDPGCAGVPDHPEQDDSVRTAQPLSGLGEVDGVICDDPDNYRLTVPGSAEWTVDLLADGDADLDLAVYDATSGDLWAHSDLRGGHETIVLDAAGDYIIEVYGYRGASGAYTLEVLDAA